MTLEGEVFVLADGGETDLDLGNYERFLRIKLSNDSNITAGKVFQVGFCSHITYNPCPHADDTSLC